MLDGTLSEPGLERREAEELQVEREEDERTRRAPRRRGTSAAFATAKLRRRKSVEREHRLARRVARRRRTPQSAARRPTNAHQRPPKPRSGAFDEPVGEQRRTPRRRAPRRGCRAGPSARGGASLQRPTCARTTVAAASGRLMKKIHRQETHSTSAPPAGGPAIVATLVNDVQSPIARPASVAVDAAQERERVRRQEGAGDALEGARDDQRRPFGAAPARSGGEREARGAGDEDAPPAVAVADRAADEVERRERQRVGEEDPLLAR